MEYMNKKKIIVNLRRFSQVLFLFLFLFLLFKTEFRGTFEERADIRLPYPVKIFLEIDPLVGISTALSTLTLYKGLIFSVIILITTLIFGRFFCGWICPFGTINNFFSSLKNKKKQKLINENRPRKFHNYKYYILAVLLASAFFNSIFFTILDPIPFLVRSLTVSVLPGINYFLRTIIDFLNGSGIGMFEYIGGGMQSVFKDNILTYEQTYFQLGFITGLIFIIIVILNRYHKRFWCRSICPLGALLGLVSRYQIFGIEKDNGKCIKCDLCVQKCQGASQPEGFVNWKSHECLMCFNCYEVCPTDVISFKLFPFEKGIDSSPDLSRRRVVLGIGVGVLFIPFIRSSTGLDKNYSPYLIRPPGSLEEREFLKRCIRCGECMKVCPTNGLQPTMTEAGLEGIWTPTLIPRIGYCEHTCVLCSQVCPTGAIWQITEEEKLGENQIKLGLAHIDKGSCLPWAKGKPCIVCEEHCPTSPKAIWLEEDEVLLRDGSTIKVQKPHIDIEKCWGCGICEYVCPVVNKPAIYVTNIGESRSEKNKILLQDD